MKTLESLLLVFLCFNYCFSQLCPQPNVQKRTIIRSAASIENGAKLLHKLTVASARNCYQECCDRENCNVAVMHYKQEYDDDGKEIMKKFCFLFECGSPSVCTFDQHGRYAVIEIPKIRNPSIKPTVSETTQEPTIAPPVISGNITEKPQLQHKKCPAGTPVAMCADNPCDKKICDSHKNAVCKPSFCGGCYAKFYDTEGKEVKCTAEPALKRPDVKSHNEETLEVASTDYEEEPVDELPGPAKSTHPDPTGDPYFQPERRKWIDGTETGHLTNATLPDEKPKKTLPNENKVIVVNTSFMSIPLMIALCICILLILGLIYRFKCAPRGKPKKFPVDDGDYLINGMYL